MPNPHLPDPLRRHWGFSLSSRGLLLGPRDVRPRARPHFLFRGAPRRPQGCAPRGSRFRGAPRGLFHGPVHSPPALGQAGRRRGSEEEPSPPAPSPTSCIKQTQGLEIGNRASIKATTGLNSLFPRNYFRGVCIAELGSNFLWSASMRLPGLQARRRRARGERVGGSC